MNHPVPPYPYLIQVAKHYPQATSTYLELWRVKDRKHKVTITKNEIRNKFLIGAAKFRNDVFSLAQEGLVSVNETWDVNQTEWYKLDIELVNFEEE